MGMAGFERIHFGLGFVSSLLKPIMFCVPFDGDQT